jgi:Asp-tRNA(Asn)/Glu-tRNA(Gln) amidotransferase A subunit family amidase
MGLVRADETTFEDNFNDMLTKNMRKEIKGSEGLPVGVHVISYPTNDEQVLYVMKELESKANFRERHRCPTVDEQPTF